MRSVIAAAAASVSMFSVSSRMSTKTGTPPRSATAFAHETNVNDGMTTSSPGPTPARTTAISNAAVQLGVMKVADPPM